MTVSTLPTEVLLRLFALARHATSGETTANDLLRRCCLVSRTWLACARVELYRELHVQLGGRESGAPSFDLPLLAREAVPIWGVERGGAARTVLEYGHLAAEVRVVAIAFASDDAYEFLEEVVTNEEKEASHAEMAQAVGILIRRVLRACPSTHSLFFDHLPGWAIRGLHSGFQRRPMSFRSLTVASFNAEDIEVAGLSLVLSLLPQIRTLCLVGAATRWLAWAMGTPPFALETLSLTSGASVNFVSSVTSSSTLSLTRLYLDAMPDTHIDLSPFRNLADIELESIAVQDGKDAGRPRPMWTPPSPSSVQHLYLGHLLPFSKLPEVPETTRSLFFTVDGAGAHTQLGGTNTSFPFFHRLADLIDQLPYLRRVTIRWFGGEWEERRGYSAAASSRLVDACAERGIELVDEVEEEIGGSLLDARRRRKETGWTWRSQW